MKIYEFEASDFSENPKIRIEEYECEETEKIFRCKPRRRIFQKSELNELRDYNRMYSTTKDPTPYIHKLLEREKAEIEQLQERIACREKRLKYFAALLKEPAQEPQTAEEAGEGAI